MDTSYNVETRHYFFYLLIPPPVNTSSIIRSSNRGAKMSAPTSARIWPSLPHAQAQPARTLPRRHIVSPISPLPLPPTLSPRGPLHLRHDFLRLPSLTAFPRFFHAPAPHTTTSRRPLSPPMVLPLRESTTSTSSPSTLGTAGVQALQFTSMLHRSYLALPSVRCLSSPSLRRSMVALVKHKRMFSVRSITCNFAWFDHVIVIRFASVLHIPFTR
jgi:hypothetical protein